jgi:hypothetical protein
VTFGSGAGPSSAGASSSSGSGVDLERILMGFVQGMQQSQQQMLQGMQQSHQQLMLQPGKHVTTLAALEDRSHRQAGLLGFEPPLSRQRTTPLFEELPDSPPAKGPAPAAAPDGTMAVFGTAAGPAGDIAAPAPAHAAAVAPAPNTMAETLAVVAVAPALQAGGDISDLLCLIEERKTEAKAKAAEAKAAKVAEAKAAKATAAATAAVGEVGAKAKAAAKAAAKPAAKAAAKPAAKPAAKAAAKPAAGAEAEAECDAIGLSAANKVALSKAKAMQKSGKVRKLKVSDGWGCSKCRWRCDGCSQCKGKEFTGFVWNPHMKG